MDTKKITHHQLMALIATGTIGGAILIVISPMVAIAKQDAWLTALITPVFGLLVMCLYYGLGRRYPGMTLIGMTRAIFGKWLGTIISSGYVAQFLYISFTMPHSISSFVGRSLHETPPNFISVFFIAAIAVGLLYGLESIARASEIILIFVSLLFFGSMILVLPNIKLGYITPIMENGITPVLKGSLVLPSLTIFSLVTIMMIYPYHVENVPKAKKPFIKGYLWASFIIFTATIMSILVLGVKVTTISSFSPLLLAKEINLGTVLTRFEFAIATMWFFTIFVIGILFNYAGLAGLAELFGMKSYKTLVLPMSLLSLMMSQIVHPSSIYVANWLNIVWLPYSATFGLIIPLITWIAAMVRNSNKRKHIL